MAIGAKNKTGFTLLEALIASALLAAAIIGICVPFVAAARSEQEDACNTIATSLAQELMEEILYKDFDDSSSTSHNGPDAGETRRSLYDSINDYDGYTESAGAITNYSGEVITDPAANGLTRSASVSYVYVAGQDQQLAPAFARVIVEIRYHGQLVLKLTRLVFNEQGG